MESGTGTRLHHIAVARSSEAASDRFFCAVLGLERVREKRASAELCGALFGVEREHRLIDYAGDTLRFEVFLVPEPEVVSPRLAHVCLEVDDVSGLLERAASAGVEIRAAAKGDSRVTFLVDADGNLYELKERPSRR